MLPVQTIVRSNWSNQNWSLVCANVINVISSSVCFSDVLCALNKWILFSMIGWYVFMYLRCRTYFSNHMEIWAQHACFTDKRQVYPIFQGFWKSRKSTRFPIKLMSMDFLQINKGDIAFRLKWGKWMPKPNGHLLCSRNWSFSALCSCLYYNHHNEHISVQ